MSDELSSRPTISEVAREAGVGRATAARTLGNYGNVSSAARERVLEAAQKLGYRANALARSMSTGVTHTIGVVVGDIANPFFAGVISGVSSAARERGFDTVVLSTTEDLDTERAAVSLLLGKRVDGIVLSTAAVTVDDAEHIADAQRNGIPVVLVDRYVAHVRADTVVIDNRTSARVAVETLLAAGHRRIGFIWGPSSAAPISTRRELEQALSETLWTDSERLRGYLDALDNGGVLFDAALVATEEKNEHGAERAVTAMLRSESPPTALFASETDAMIGALRAIRAAGLSYPEDISLVGFDDSSWAAVMEPALTMVEQPMRALGVRSAERLLARIDGETEAPEVVTLPTTLIERGSVAPPPRA